MEILGDLLRQFFSDNLTLDQKVDLLRDENLGLKTKLFHALCGIYDGDEEEEEDSEEIGRSGRQQEVVGGDFGGNRWSGGGGERRRLFENNHRRRRNGGKNEVSGLFYKGGERRKRVPLHRVQYYDPFDEFRPKCIS